MAGIERQLHVGQTVSLREQPFGYQVAPATPEEPGTEVAEVGPDYVVFDNAAAGVKTRIPVHLLSLAAPPAPAAVPAPAAEPAETPQAAPQAA